MRTRARLLPLCLPALLLGGCDRAEDVVDDVVEDVAGPTVPDEVSYVALGDSIAAGSAADTSYVTEYAARFEAETGASVTVTNAAVPGWTAEDLLTAVRSDQELREAIAAAHLVTFNIGGNDLLAALRLVVEGRCGGVDGRACVRDAVSGLTATWDELLAELEVITGGDVRGLRTMDLYRPAGLEDAGAHRNALERHLDAVNHHITTTAEGAGIPVARVNSAFQGEGEGTGADPLLADPIHPSDRGHVLIAERLMELGPQVREPA